MNATSTSSRAAATACVNSGAKHGLASSAFDACSSRQSVTCRWLKSRPVSSLALRRSGLAAPAREARAGLSETHSGGTNSAVDRSSCSTNKLYGPRWEHKVGENLHKVDKLIPRALKGPKKRTMSRLFNRKLPIGDEIKALCDSSPALVLL